MNDIDKAGSTCSYKTERQRNVTFLIYIYHKILTKQWVGSNSRIPVYFLLLEALYLLCPI